MSSRVTKFATGLAAAAFAALAITAPAEAGSRDKVFFKGVQGEWTGPGKFLEGSMKGTRFNCNLSGTSQEKNTGMILDGYCRVGILRYPMKAVITNNDGTYTGQFLDGAKSDGFGFDVVSGNVTEKRVIVGISRKKINGSIVARMQDKNTMSITIRVNAQEQVIPFIAINLTRDPDQVATGSVE